MQSLPLADPGVPDLRSPLRFLLRVVRWTPDGPLDPRAARHLERSLAAVVEDGRVGELGSHDALLALGGSYAAPWASWQSDGAR